MLRKERQRRKPTLAWGEAKELGTPIPLANLLGRAILPYSHAPQRRMASFIET
jgi:hypothetical protein